MRQKKDINLNFIRCVAVFCVLSVHFFLNSGFYEMTIIGTKMYILTFLRTCFAICVPLFLMLSGFLMNQKTISKKYFFSILKVVIPYILSMCCIGLYQFLVMEGYSYRSLILDITSFSYYSWYIEMYLGLYLLIPFLNVLYHNLKKKEQKELLVIVFAVITIMPTLFNAFDVMLFPDWWQNFYPLTYYFLGAYIAENKEEFTMSLKKNIIFLCISLLCTSGFCYFRSYNNVFNWGSWCTAGGIANLLNAPLVFLVFLRIPLKNMSEYGRKVIDFIARISLPVYLVSYIFDSLWYPVLNTKVALEQRILYYPISIVIVFGSSCILGMIVEKIAAILYRGCCKIFEKNP